MRAPPVTARTGARPWVVAPTDNEAGNLERLVPATTAGPPPDAPTDPAPPAPPERRRSRGRQWWTPSLVLAAVATALFVLAATSVAGPGRLVASSAGWWLFTTVLHVPLLVILCFLACGIVERLGFYVRGRAAAAPGLLPTTYPTVCVQLPMFTSTPSPDA